MRIFPEIRHPLKICHLGNRGHPILLSKVSPEFNFSFLKEKYFYREVFENLRFLWKELSPQS